MNQYIIEDVIFRPAFAGMVGLFGIFDQDARLQLRALILTDPGQFEFLLFLRHAFRGLIELSRPPTIGS